MTSPASVNCRSSPAIPSPIPVMDVFPNRTSSSTPPPFASSVQQCSSPFSRRPFDHECRTPPPNSVKRRSKSSPRMCPSSSQSPQGPTFLQCPSRFDSLNDGASHNLRQRLYSSPQLNSPAIFRASLNKSIDIHATPSLTFRFGPHPDLCVVKPSINVKLKH